jgi:hypothetical protein
VEGDNKRRETDLSDISQGTIDKKKKRVKDGRQKMHKCTYEAV